MFAIKKKAFTRLIHSAQLYIPRTQTPFASSLVELRFVVIQLLGCVWLFVTPWTATHQASLSFTISQSFLKLMSIESVMPSNHLILCRLLLLPSIFPGLRSQWVSSSHQVGQSTGASASASVLPVTIQGWFALGLTGLISLLSKGLSKSLLQYHNSSVRSLLYGPTLISIHDYWKNHSFDYSDLCQQGDVSAF